MSLAKTAATSRRVLSQLRHDSRTLGLVLVVPCLLVTLLKYVFAGQPSEFNNIAPMILGIFPLLTMFLVTSIATLRERRTGTLDRLMTMPISKADFILGYAAAFSVLATIQAVLASVVTLGLLRVSVMGGTLPLLVTAVLAAFLGTSLGLFVSAFASSEFQAVELIMPALMPQILLCGLFVARADMARPLRWLSDVFPVTYSVDAMKQVTVHTGWPHEMLRDLIVVTGFALVALILGSITIRRQEKQ